MTDKLIKAMRLLLIAAACLATTIGLSTAWATAKNVSETEIMNVRVDLQERQHPDM